MSYRRKPRGDDQRGVDGVEEKNIWKVSFGIQHQAYNPLWHENTLLNVMLTEKYGARLLTEHADGIIYKVRGSVIKHFFPSFSSDLDTEFILKRYKDPNPIKRSDGTLTIDLGKIHEIASKDQNTQKKLINIQNVIIAFYWGYMFCVMKDGGINLFDWSDKITIKTGPDEERFIEKLYVVYRKTLAILTDLHVRNIYHNDIHAGNILVQDYGDNMNVNLIDFTRSDIRGRKLTHVNPFIKDLERVGVEMLRLIWTRYLRRGNHILNPYDFIVGAWLLMDTMTMKAKSCAWKVSLAYYKMFALLYVGARAASRLTECSQEVISSATDDSATLEGLGNGRIPSTEWWKIVSQMKDNIERVPKLKQYLTIDMNLKAKQLDEFILKKIFKSCHQS